MRTLKKKHTEKYLPQWYEKKEVLIKDPRWRLVNVLSILACALQLLAVPHSCLRFVDLQQKLGKLPKSLRNERLLGA